ncbi:MAG TPA: UDP-N-acetylmuramoyl-L-alanyl-D-glutamate--2,6-diaminopimelate ligase, partial [Desulfobacteraceae bacterium]|nr:UDP-N-acetylmuramoyl-L-alanyl-D-glutamate--2,6-diaminopimelate ligase [Desulfobacteraceae bacterium]
ATGIDLNAIASGLGRLTGVPGRLEMVRNRRALAIVVDYAHTPDALLKALNAVRLLTTGRVITVFGCGGDRDRGKRREMGRVAGMGSDRVFITSDNPRTEDPAAIAAQIEAGVIESGIREYVLDLDRRQAIRRAVKMADRADVVLIAGKGHETYQIIGHEKRPFDDRLVAAEAADEPGDG